MRRGAILVVLLIVIAILVAFLSRARVDGDSPADGSGAAAPVAEADAASVDAASPDAGVAEGTGTPGTSNRPAQLAGTDEVVTRRAPGLAARDERPGADAAGTTGTAAARAEEPTPAPDERGRIRGTDRPALEETPEYQRFVATMDTAYDGVLEGFADCVEQAPALQGQALSVRITHFDSGRPPQVSVDGAELDPRTAECFGRKVAAVELPMPWNASTLENERYSIQADTAAEFSWKFDFAP